MNILKQAVFVKGRQCKWFPGTRDNNWPWKQSLGVMTHSDLIWHAYRNSTCDKTAQNQMHAKREGKMSKLLIPLLISTQYTKYCTGNKIKSKEGVLHSWVDSLAVARAVNEQSFNQIMFPAVVVVEIASPKPAVLCSVYQGTTMCLNSPQVSSVQYCAFGFAHSQ